MMLVAFLVLVFPHIGSSQAQSVTTFSSDSQFRIPELNGSIGFSVNGSYSSATLTNNRWVFKDLRLNNSQVLGTLEFSAQDSNVTILAYRSYNSSFGRSASISYFASGQGQQIINLGLNSTQANPTQWSVIVRGNVFLAKDQGWTFLPDNSFEVTDQTGTVIIVRFAFTNPYDDSNQPFLIRHSIIIITGAALAGIVAVAAVIYHRGRVK